MLWYFECDRGCGIRDLPARQAHTAKPLLLRETGAFDPPRNIRRATKDDIAWIGVMGGDVPNPTKRKHT